MGRFNTILLALVLSAQATSGPTFAQSLGVVVSGRVTGPPASTAGKKIWMNGTGLFSATIQPDGSFEFAKVPRGQYRVTFDPPADSFVRIVDVGTGDLKGIEIPYVISSFKVTGTATGETALRQQGRIAADEFVWVSFRSSYLSGRQPGTDGYKGVEYRRDGVDRQRINPDGTFQFSNVPQGTYTLHFFKNCICCPPGKSGGCDDINLWKADITDVVITDRDVTGLTFPLKF